MHTLHYPTFHFGEIFISDIIIYFFSKLKVTSKRAGLIKVKQLHIFPFFVEISQKIVIDIE